MTSTIEKMESRFPHLSNFFYSYFHEGTNYLECDSFDEFFRFFYNGINKERAILIKKDVHDLLRDKINLQELTNFFEYYGGYDLFKSENPYDLLNAIDRFCDSND